MLKIRYFFLLIVPFFLSKSFGQNDQDIESNSNELKLNVFNLIVFPAIDLNYEYLINEESSIGTGVFIFLGDEDDIEYYKTFSFTPFYRRFFSKKYAKGFFIEGFASFLTGKDVVFFGDPISESTVDQSYTEFALGISVGGKFVTPRGFIAEIYAGIGRNLLGDENANELTGRGGVSLGFRF